MEIRSILSREKLPLSSNQKRLWIISQQDKTNPAYNLQLTYRLEGNIDKGILDRSLTLLFEKHNTLFSVFREEDGNPHINIEPGIVETEYLDFSGFANDQSLVKVLSFIGQESRRPIDISEGPLYRLFLIKENANSFYFHATIHHIIFDGWSRRIFVQELSKIYTEISSGKVAAPEPARFLSFDYAGLENQLLTKDEEEELSSFWSEYLRDCQTELRLPLDFPRKAFSTGIGCRERFELSKECTKELKNISSREDTSLFNVVISLLGILFQKYSGEHDICIGVPVSNRRNFPSSEETLGLFINTIVVRQNIETSKSFEEQIKASRDSVRAAVKNSKLPFDKIVEAAKPERIAGINPLFQVSLSWITDQTIPLELNGIKGSRVSVPEGISPFDITFYIWEDEETIKGDVEYNTDILSRDTIRRLINSFLSIASSAAFTSSSIISKVSVISDEDKLKLEAFNDTFLDVPDTTIHKLIEEQSVNQSGKTALIYGTTRISYKEMDEEANKLAWCLMSMGIKTNDTVALCLERSHRMIIAILGILKSGCSYLPIDPSFPEERISFMLENSQSGLLISEKNIVERFTKLPDIQTLLLDNDREKILGSPSTKPPVSTESNSTAYIIYTSGSTGRPKGVRVLHRSVVNLIKSMSVRPGMSVNDILLAVVTLSFDMSVFELFVPLANGATIVIADSDDLTDSMALTRLIEENNISIIQGTPSFWSILLSGGWNGKKDLKALCGGEALTHSMVREMLPRVGEFWNCYGPTETTVYSTCTRIYDENALIHIGKPIHNTSIHIIDKENNPLPPGVTGEVAVGGKGLTEGYHNNPDLTKEKFLMLPDGTRVYKTGDLGRFLSDGNVELFGRADNQIKIRGFRIEPGEIETQASKLDGVKECVVRIHKFDEYDERLVAFLNTGNEFRMKEEEVISSLSQNLPAYMVPSYVRILKGFPRLPNGKIDKKSLIFNVTDVDTLQKINPELLNSTQKTLLTIWESVVKTKPTSMNDSFFEAGGNSLLGLRLINKINEEFVISVQYRELISYASFSRLADLIDSKTGMKKESVELIHLTTPDRLPLTQNQKRLWFISRMEPDKPVYIIRNTFLLSGPLDTGILESSINLLFKRHHVVFSSVREENGEPYCTIKEWDISLPVMDLSHLSKDERKLNLDALLDQDSKKGFDLENGPLFRIYLVKTDSTEYCFHLSIHHIVFDGWSQGIFINELSLIYNSLISNKEFSLDPLKFQQYDYAYWENDRTVDQLSNEFWEETLKGCSPVINFPYDYARGDKNSGSGSLETIVIPDVIANAVKQISKEEGTSLFTTLMTVFGILMSRYSGEDDLNIGLPVAHRPHTELEKVFGVFVNTIIFRFLNDGNQKFRDLLRSSHNRIMDAISHQDTPYDKVVELVNPDRIPGINPLFQVAFAWQNNLYVPLNLEGIKSAVIKSDKRAATFDITFAMWENGGTIEGEIEYNTDLIKPETIKRLKDHFILLTRKLTENSNSSVGSLPLISEEESRMILRVNDNSTEYPRNKTIVQVFEENVVKYSDHPAISYKGSFLSYREMNQKANQIARTLRSGGIRPNMPVGIVADKSLELITGILAILKAGGCYAPIDPEYPAGRVEFIIKDAGIKAVLVQSKYEDRKFEGAVKYNLDIAGTYDLDGTNLTPVNTPDDLAYILYTSGTTGIPKGTPIRHRGVNRLVLNTNFSEWNHQDRILLSGAVVFDATTLEIWGSLLNGATLFIIDKDTLLNTDVLYEVILNNKITTFITTSALFNHLVETQISIFQPLKYTMVGGDILSPDHCNRVRRINPDLMLVNGYGPTENSTMSTFYHVDTDFSHSIPIGKPNSNSTVYVFDKYMNHQPVGLVGELYVGGDGLSPGYLNREDLNIKCFVENPHNPGERLYKTGDLVMWLPDGNIEFRGRADNQIKIRGFRVELEEIETVLSDLEDVVEAVVKPVKVDAGDYNLVAFLNVNEKFNSDEQEILKQIKSKLPAYMIPDVLKTMHGFPRTINGKIDRKALIFDPAEFGKRKSLELDNLSPLQKRIFDIWTRIVKTRITTIDESFFDIGGTSLTGLRMLNLIREDFGLTLTFKELLANSSIYKLSKYIEEQGVLETEGIKLIHVTRMTDLPLTSNQKRLWLISRMDPDSPSYIIPYTYRLSGDLDRDILQKSIGILFNRHHIVFSVIKEKDGVPFLDIMTREVEIDFHDHKNLSEDEREAVLVKMLRDDSLKPFDLANGPLFRLFLIQTSEKEHLFHISLHHIIFDGWSWSVFVHELSAIYSALIKGEKVALPDIEYQQYDFATWETSTQASDHEKISSGFWQASLKGCSHVINFPYDFKRKDISPNRGSHEKIMLSGQLTNRIKTLAKAEGLSTFTTLLGAFGILLNKYSGEDDLNIGLWVANRPHTKLESIFGMFVNTIVARMQYSKKLTINQILKNSSETALNAISHQDISFDKVVSLINPERTTNVNPLFQVVFAWQDDLGVDLKLEGIRTAPVTYEERTVAFDLTLSLWENEGCIQGLFEYNLDLFRQGTVIRMKENFINLLETITAFPGITLDQVTVLSETDKKLINAFNDTITPVPGLLIHNMIEEQAERNPGKTAIIAGNRSLTYEELNWKSNQMARHLISLGLVSGDAIGICLERTEMMVVAVIAVFKAGCCYLPMDPSFPDDRLNYMFEDSGARALISQSNLSGKFSHIETQLVLVDKEEEVMSLNSKRNPETRISNQSIAYLIYTSGSTGRPKGVLVHHEAVVNFLLSMSKEPGITTEDRLLAVTTLSFDISVLELFLPLITGAELVLASSDQVTDGRSLGEIVRNHDITILQATPATWTLLLSEGWRGKKNMKALCGGEALPPYLVQNLLPMVKELWNMYGPTETTVWSSCCQITDPDETITVGKPINNTTINILDSNNRQLPVGVIGEVAIGGMGVTKGYHNRPELTEEKFTRLEEGMIYKTGDQGRLLENGTLEILGRIDNQVKLRGFRIEPGEIEAVISGLAGVKETVVKIHRFDEKDERLVAFLNIDSDFAMPREQIVESISRKLPAYMIPSFFQTSEEFPRLPNGKINKKALVLEIDDTAQSIEVDIETLPETHKELYKMWQEILKIKSLKLSDSFFDIGGNSLLAVSLINKIKEHFEAPLTFKDIVTNPSISKISNLIDSRKTIRKNAITLYHLNDTGHLPLTANQKRLWLISKLNPDIPSYIIPYTYHFSGSLDIDAFRKSIEIIFNRHHTVFSVIRNFNGEPVCEIKPAPVNIHTYDFQSIPEKEKIEKVAEVFSNDIRTVFSLEEGPLYRIHLIKAGTNDFYMRLSLHHIIFDAWSWSVFSRELNEVYNSLTNGREPVLDKIEFQQYDFAHWERANMDSMDHDDLKEFWKNYLKGSSPVLNFPYDYPRNERQTGRSKNETIIIPPDLTGKLKELSRAANTSMFATMLSAFGILLHKYSSESDINIGLPVTYRPHSKLERVFGMFVNTVVVRQKYTDKSTFRKMILETGSDAFEAIAHQDLPFEKIVEAVNPTRISNINPLFQAGFTWQNFTDKPLSLNGLQCNRIKGEDGVSVFDLSFYMWENGNRVEGEMEYNVDLLAADTIVSMKENFLNLLRVLTDNPDKPLDELSYLSEKDISFITEINKTDCPYEKGLCIHHKFEDIARKFPDLPAILIKGKNLTYRELNEHSNRMANFLITRGVKVEDKVGICIDRSLEMMISIFGTLKAGAAYVPLSPDNPTERLRKIISDSEPKIILTGDTSSANLPDECQKVFTDGIIEKPLCDNSSNPDVEMSSGNLAYVLYTSGSTGIPKGVMIEHHSVLNRLGWMQKAYPIDTEDTLLQKTPITFDVSVWELFWWAFNGSKLVLLPKGGEKDPETIADFIADFKVTTIHFVPSMFASFLETVTTKDLTSKLECMKRIFLSGEALPLSVVREFNEMRDRYSLPDLINLYGPTEATVDVSYYLCPRQDITNVYIGRPIDNTKLFVVNEKNVIQPVGVPGELLITGVNLARGYINRPELTSEKFFGFKLPAGFETRAYHTGDLVKLTPEGEVYYLGRIDNQVKIRGFRIELGEIESKIMEHPLVSNCAVVVVEKAKNKFLCAYVCMKPGNMSTSEELKSYIATQLPDYMVPPYIVFMDTLPLTQSGKLDRKNLPLVETAFERDSIINPSNQNEELLLDIWKNLLNNEKISVNDNFFDIGGNSLLAINLANAISNKFSKSIKALFIFEYPSIKSQSDYLSGNNEKHITVKKTEIEEKAKLRKNVSFKKLR